MIQQKNKRNTSDEFVRDVWILELLNRNKTTEKQYQKNKKNPTRAKNKLNNSR
ncbi:MAG TPA: hypothetical protein VFI73_02495 [Candidatus Nitrosopolaris sp.]|nr:hypothetical protein [Candidatus Nitrosopolaris sp.]